MKNGKKVVQNGETVLMDKAKVPVKYIEVPEKVVNQAISNKPREKKPLSDKQKENLQRLIELNKKRREEKLAAIRVNVDELGEIPEDKVVVRVVKGKGAGRPRKQKQTQSGRPDRRESESENEVVEEPYGSSASEEPSGCLAIPRDGILKLKRESKKVARRPLSEEEEEEEEKTPPKPIKKPAPKKGKIVAPRAREQSTKAGSTRKPRSYFSETSETSGVDADSDSDSEDEEVVQRKVEKYVAKTKARMEALKQIEQQLKPQSKYAGMSIF